MEQAALFTVVSVVVQAKPGECAQSAVPLAPVPGGDGQTIAWQCPRCLAASAVRMPVLPKGATVCPVCRKEFKSVRRHWAQQYQWRGNGLYGDSCRKFYEAGMIRSKDRPAWASHSEQAGG